MHPVNGSNARQAFTSPLFWAFMLMCVLVGGVVLGFVAMRRTTSATSPSPHLKPMAMLEAMVAISAGVLLWMGFWDFIDVYLVPRQWWAKLCMVIVGALGSILTRSLYDEQAPSPNPDLTLRLALPPPLPLPQREGDVRPLPPYYRPNLRLVQPEPQP